MAVRSLVFCLIILSLTLRCHLHLREIKLRLQFLPLLLGVHLPEHVVGDSMLLNPLSHLHFVLYSSERFVSQFVAFAITLFAAAHVLHAHFDLLKEGVIEPLL